MKYDVIIVGAGPAGAQCARYISEHSQHSVLLLDKTQEIGEPKKSTAGTFPETIETFALPNSVVMNKSTSLILEGPTKTTELAVDGYVLDFWKLKKFLVEEAVHHGTEVRIKATVTKPFLQNNRIAGVIYEDLDGPHEVQGKIIIDASGPAAVLATQLGLKTLNQKAHFVGIEYEMDKLELQHQYAMLMRFDHRYAPGGYSWIFSTGNNHAKVGNCWGLEFFKKNGGNGSGEQYLKKWITSDKRLKNGFALEIHGGDAYLEPAVSKRSMDNFMAIGDSVSSIHPLFGEGIRPGMFSGIFAAQTAIESLKKNDTSAKQLKKYDTLWKQKYGNYKLACMIMNVLYTLSNDNFDRFVRNLRRLDDAAVQRIISYQFTLKDFLKLLPISIYPK